VLSSLCKNSQLQSSTERRRCESRRKLTLVDISLSLVGGLVELVSDGILSGSGAGAQAGITVLGDALVSLLGSLSTGALNGLGNVVGGVLWVKVRDVNRVKVKRRSNAQG
jgi:hypothetical protein